MDRYYVLWTNAACRDWAGPYDTFEEAIASTPMQERYSDAIVTMASA